MAVPGLDPGIVHGHPRLAGAQDGKAWVAGTSPAMTPGLSLLVLEVADLAVRALLPGVEHVALFLLAADDVAVVGDVALLVERDAAGDSVARLAGMHHLGDLLGVERFRLLGRLLDDLYGGVAVERIGLGLEAALLAEQLDDR